MIIERIPNCPDDGKHLRIVFPFQNFPFSVTKGEDWNRDKRHLWCVHPRVITYSHGDFQRAETWFGKMETSYHRTPEKAYQVAIARAKRIVRDYLDSFNSCLY